jgi:hypothetical protein
MTLKESNLTWAMQACIEADEQAPEDLLEALMSYPECPAFGPAHHFLVGAALVTCHDRAKGLDDETLASDLEELHARSSQLPGATCAKWGICSAGISAGMAYAIVAGNAPLRSEGWSEGQLMVSQITDRIAQAGSPRCCKRDARIALDVAARTFERDFGVSFPPASARQACAVADQNSVCLSSDCPFFAASR